MAQKLPPAVAKALIDACIEHLTEHAAEYFDMVKARSKEQGIIWAVFVPGRNHTGGSRHHLHQAAATQPRVDLKRVSFLPLTTVVATNAPSLLSMYQSCRPDVQFVAWFTMENEAGEPLLSKVMLVDVAKGGSGDSTSGGDLPSAAVPPLQLQQQQPLPALPAATSPLRQRLAAKDRMSPDQRHRATLDANMKAIEALKDDMHRFKANAGDGFVAGPRNTPHRTRASTEVGYRGGPAGGMTPLSAREREVFLQQLQQNPGGSGGASRPGAAQSSNTDVESRTDSRPGGDTSSEAAGGIGGANQPPHHTSMGEFSAATYQLAQTAASAQSYQQLLRVTLQIADTVARLGQVVDRLDARFRDLESTVANLPRPPKPEVIVSLSSRLDSAENTITATSHKLTAIEALQAQYFEHLTEVKHHLDDVSGQVDLQRRLVSNGSGLSSNEPADGPISYEHRMRRNIGLAEQRDRDEREVSRGGKPGGGGAASKTTPSSFFSDGGSGSRFAGGGEVLPSAASFGDVPFVRADAPSKMNLFDSAPQRSSGNSVVAASAPRSSVSTAPPSDAGDSAPDRSASPLAPESLSDMIKAMERKLSRIKMT